jgi:hypothetical protein
MIDLSFAVTDPRFAQIITVIRNTGKYVAGRFILDTPQTIEMAGVISIANAKQIQFIPEGDRIGGEIAIHATQPLYNSRNATDLEKAGISDEILWHGDLYKIYQVNEYSDYGYYFAIGQRKASD